MGHGSWVMTYGSWVMGHDSWAAPIPPPEVDTEELEAATLKPAPYGAKTGVTPTIG